MFLVGHEDFVAGLEIQAIRDVAVSLRGVPQKGDLVAVATYKGSEWITELVPRSVSPNGVVFGIGLVELLAGFVAFKNCAQDRSRTGADSTVVKINLVGGYQELLAQLAPVGLFVRVI